MLLVLDRTRYMMMDVILAALINLALDILLIPTYGIIGAALSTSVSIISVTVLDSFFAWRFSRINPLNFKAILKSISAGVVSMMVIMLTYRLAGFSSSLAVLLPLFIVFILLYFALLVVFRALDRDDVFIITEIEKKIGMKGVLGKFLNKFVNNKWRNG
jgi:O-antigen/teichoic acid export membrane protein